MAKEFFFKGTARTPHGPVARVHIGDGPVELWTRDMLKRRLSARPLRGSNMAQERKALAAVRGSG
jgi:hypothetical protein